MGGKGQRRREKNFQAAHGGNSRLPPPPKPKEIDALPSKLRTLMQFKNNPPKQGTLLSSSEATTVNGKQRAGEKEGSVADRLSLTKANLKREDIIKKGTSGKHVDDTDETTNSSKDNAKKRKRKRKVVDDLRFQNIDEAAVHSKRKERRKEYFKSRKQKHKKAKTDDIREFPGREEIKFGEVVKAPPKLTFPKARKGSMDASTERARLQAVEAYRNRRGWVSRPGLQLPNLAETSL